MWKALYFDRYIKLGNFKLYSSSSSNKAKGNEERFKDKLNFQNNIWQTNFNVNRGRIFYDYMKLLNNGNSDIKFVYVNGFIILEQEKALYRFWLCDCYCELIAYLTVQELIDMLLHKNYEEGFISNDILLKLG